jgi:hypothetical protein
VIEKSITADLNVTSGEPEIAIDPTDPRRLAIVEFALGSDRLPAWSLHPIIQARGADAGEAMRDSARVQLSGDGGETWRAVSPPIYDPTHNGAADPAIAFGPDGALYVAAVPMPKTLGDLGTMHKMSFFIAVSMDGGRSFSAPVAVPAPVDRPFIRVDHSTGTVYLAGSGTFNPTSAMREAPGPGVIEDRWLVAFKPHLEGQSEPRRMGGPDFSVKAGMSFTASNGVVATAFVLGGPAHPETAPLPPSLRALVKDGTQTCSQERPCLFFQTSRDDGRSWARHYVPVPGGFSVDIFTYVSSDAGRAGRYAIGLMNPDATGLRVLVTDDSGVTWSSPATVVQTSDAPPVHAANQAGMDVFERGNIIRPWMEYGPTGVLGFIWKQRRDDVSGPPARPNQPGFTWGTGFDVYAGISCDGGKTWLPPVRVNAETSPPGSTTFDDLSYVALDARYAHLVWGDRRNSTKITNAKMGIGGVQAYYARVPFSIATHGTRCGRASAK